MKANEAPEKLYLSDIQRYFDDTDKTASTIKYADDDIEYIRITTFIEKAVGWIDYNNRNGGCNFCGWEEDFKNYMKGE